MAYKTKAEKRAWRKGLFAGFKKSKKRASKNVRHSKRKTPKRTSLPSGAYNLMGRIDENRVDDLHGPVVFWDDDFEFDSKG